MADAVVGFGFIVFVGGLAMVSIPMALIIGGLGLMAFGVLLARLERRKQ